MTRHDENHIMSLSDFLLLCRRKKKLITGCLIFFAAAGFLYGITRQVVFEAEGTYREKSRSSSMISPSVTEMILGTTTKNESEAVTMLKSRKLIEELVQHKGLQAQLKRNELRIPFIGRIFTNLRTELAYWTKSGVPFISDLRDQLQVRDLFYEREFPTSLTIRILDHNNYEVYDGNEGLFYKGVFGFPLIHENYVFTLIRAPDGKEPAHTYTLKLLPLRQVTKDIQESLDIDADKEDKNLIRISYAHPERHTASNFVNDLMSTLQSHQRREHDRISDIQVHYLENRQGEIEQNLLQSMQKHASNVTNELSSSGFLGSQKEIEFLAMSLMNCKQKLMDIDLETRRLENVVKGPHCAYYDQYTSRGDPSIINDILGKIRDLERHKDSLNIALESKTSEIKNEEFQGLDLTTSNQLYLSYSAELSKVQAERKQYEFVIQEMKDPAFEVSSLSTLLHDPVSIERINKASSLLVSIQDDNNRSSREQQRLKEDVAVEKEFLATHLKQTAQLLELRENLLKEKIQALQSSTLDLIHQQIAILQKHLGEYAISRLDNLKQEKVLLEKHQQDLNQKMSALPEKWVSERLLDQRLDMNQKMAEELTKLVESKNITNNLELIQSAPVDPAFPAIHPKNPRIVFFTVLGAFFGTLFSLACILISSIKEGIPASAANLKLAGKVVAGSLSPMIALESEKPLLDSDLETLRRITAFIEEHAISSLLILKGQGTDYSLNLAKLLKAQGKKAVILQMSFQKESEGLLQYLQRRTDSPKITCINGIDFILPGGITRFSNEFLLTPRFQELLTQLKEKYDIILGVSETPLSKIEAEKLGNKFAAIAISIHDETLSTLEPYFTKQTIFIEV